MCMYVCAVVYPFVCLMQCGLFVCVHVFVRCFCYPYVPLLCVMCVVVCMIVAGLSCVGWLLHRSLFVFGWRVVGLCLLLEFMIVSLFVFFCLLFSMLVYVRSVVLCEVFCCCVVCCGFLFRVA